MIDESIALYVTSGFDVLSLWNFDRLSYLYYHVVLKYSYLLSGSFQIQVEFHRRKLMIYYGDYPLDLRIILPVLLLVIVMY